MKTTLFIILALFVSCRQVTKRKDNVFTVNNAFNLKQDSILKGLINEIPAPRAVFYLYNHFIVDSSGQMFYYQLPFRGTSCGEDYNYEIPEYIGLKPHNLIQVPEKSIQDFIRLNILSQKHPFLDNASSGFRFRVVLVGLLKDTVVSDGLASLRDIIHTDSSMATWYIRKATLEESVVLEYKKAQKYYFAEEVEWDTAKIKFHHLDSNYIKLRKLVAHNTELNKSWGK